MQSNIAIDFSHIVVLHWQIPFQLPLSVLF